MVTRWAPLLEGELAERSFATLAAVAATLRATAPVRVNGMLSIGDAGTAVVHGYLAQVFPDHGHEDAALAHLDSAGLALADGRSTVALLAGFSGVAWAVDHLGDDGDHGGDDDPNADVDEALIDALTGAPWPGHYDLTFGLIGVGVYALQRLARPTGRAIADLVLARLVELAETHLGGQVTWLTPSSLLREPDFWPENTAGRYDLGAAHGVPGVIAFLAALHARGIARPTVTPLLRGAITWLLAQHGPPGSGFRFPQLLLPSGESMVKRQAWCYGDPGVVLPLFHAARLLGEPSWEAEALALARHLAGLERAATGLETACLCHGDAGMAHLFHRLYRATGDETFAAAARRWFAYTVDHALETRDHSLLTGLGGIALALVSAVRPIAPDWDAILVMSL